MKRLMAIVVIALAGLTSASAVAQTLRGNVRLLTVQYNQDMPPVPIAAVYDINGGNYPVDYNRRIWSRNAYGVWFVIGFIQTREYGEVAVLRGRIFPATRVE